MRIKEFSKIDEEWYDPTTWFNSDEEKPKADRDDGKSRKKKVDFYRAGVSGKTQNAICNDPDLRAMNPKACK
jgi:hypothetical protein